MKCSRTCACACVATLSDAHGARLINVARRQGLSEEDARDAVQDALSSFIDLSRDRDLCAISVDGGAYLTAMVVNVARNMRRRHFRRRPHAGGVAVLELADERASPEELVAGREGVDHLYGCLESLDDVPRKIVSLRIIEDVSGTEVAKLLDLSPTHVAVLLHRAKRSLSACMTSSKRLVADGSRRP